MPHGLNAGWSRTALAAVALLSLPATACWTATPADALPYTDGTLQAGATKVATCIACHGPNGNSTNPQWPKLAGQNAVYTAEQLRLFKTAVRNNPVMMPMATNLSAKDIDDIAVYFEGQTPNGGEADPSYWKAGEALYTGGDGTRSIPACVACHGPVGVGNLAAGYPALRAQFAEYVMKQLNDYASGARYAGAHANAQPSPNSVMMMTIAKRLTPEDIRNVASYVQGMR
ncbi:MAG TPA: c-type cytochrome [Steroidobacteraceae bacterium]|nr:c-type cytochrome [Steroidobacteraceae bacterium]